MTLGAKDIPAALGDLLCALVALDPDQRAALSGDEATRELIARTCRQLHALHASAEPAPDPRDGPKVVSETTLSGRPVAWVPAESEEAVEHWDERLWRRP
jgi:hypothetical protein